MARAIWNGEVIAESATFETIEGNTYFPPTSLRCEYFQPIDKTTECSWKGTAHYYNLIVDGKENQAGAWTYPNPKPAAQHIKDHVAFWRGVVVEQ